MQGSNAQIETSVPNLFLEIIINTFQIYLVDYIVSHIQSSSYHVFSFIDTTTGFTPRILCSKITISRNPTQQCK